MPDRIFVVEDHASIRDGLYTLIGVEDGLSVCGHADSAEDALDRIEAAAPDLALVDVSLPGMSGIALAGHLRDRLPDLPVLILSGHDEAVYGASARAAGVRGYVMKYEGPERIVAAIRAALADEPEG